MTQQSVINIPTKRSFLARVSMLRFLKSKVLIEIVAVLYMSMFIYTAYSKWVDYTLSQEQIALMPLMMPIAHIVIWLLPSIEIAISVLIFFPITRRTGFYSATILMVLFTVYIIYMMVFYPELPCSCGGFLNALSWDGHLIFNGSYILLGVAAIRMLRRENFIRKK